jgi:hypothetical protein
VAQTGECGEEAIQGRIGGSQVSLHGAKGSPLAQSQIRRDGHELHQAGQNHHIVASATGRGGAASSGGMSLGCHRLLLSVA